MRTDKFKIYLLELLFIVVLFFALFLSNIVTRQRLAVFMALYGILVGLLLRRRGILSIFQKQVTVMMTLFAFGYLLGFYSLGLYFGFTKAKVMLSWWSFWRFIVPLSIIIISGEWIRYVFLNQKTPMAGRLHFIDLSKIMTFIGMVLLDLLIYTGVYDLTNLDDFLTAMGFVLFASISCNLLYNYVTVRFGWIEIVIYRLVTILFIYIIPVTPNIYIFLRSFLRMLYPYIIYLILERSYAKTNLAVSYTDRRNNFIGTTILIIIMSLVIMLISCKFTYGIIVVGSESMTGTINKGDAVVFKSYKTEEIDVGDIIIFQYHGIKTIHRVTEIRNINGEIRYFTKGDANKKADDDYTLQKDVIGVVKYKIKYLGYPTIFVRELFKS